MSSYNVLKNNKVTGELDKILNDTMKVLVMGKQKASEMSYDEFIPRYNRVRTLLRASKEFVMERKVKAKTSYFESTELIDRKPVFQHFSNLECHTTDKGHFEIINSKKVIETINMNLKIKKND